MTRTPNYSFGGKLVEATLQDVGYHTADPSHAIIETVVRFRRLDSVLVQNAWNALPWRPFWRQLVPYPWKWRLRAIARRAVARRNVRGARRVVVLSHSMRELVATTFARPVEVAPVTAPLSIFADIGAPTADPPWEFCLVPGTVTWYKNPEAALQWLHDQRVSVDVVMFCGIDDGSGCWEAVQATADRLGILVLRTIRELHDLYALMKTAKFVILPSTLESFGFALAEALMLQATVVASPISAHVEVAQRIGHAPIWMDGSRRDVRSDAPRIGEDQARLEWAGAGDALRLARRDAAPTP